MIRAEIISPTLVLREFSGVFKSSGEDGSAGNRHMSEEPRGDHDSNDQRYPFHDRHQVAVNIVRALVAGKSLDDRSTAQSKSSK